MGLEGDSIGTKRSKVNPAVAHMHSDLAIELRNGWDDPRSRGVTNQSPKIVNNARALCLRPKMQQSSALTLE